MRDTTVKANYDHIGLDVNSPPTGDGLRIAIADSILHPPTGFAGSTGDSVDCSPEVSGETETAARFHGRTVSRIVSTALPDATFDFYRVVRSDTADEVGPEFLVPAIQHAVDNSVDLLNVSAGVDGRVSGIRRVYERAVRRATEAGTTVVAAAGNDPDFARLGYPARLPGVVSVGGCLVRCNRFEQDHSKDTRIWIERNGTEHGEFCSARGCSRRSTCRGMYQAYEWWSGNVEPTGGDPTTLAPCFAVVVEDGEITEGYGTSFAAPYVTGALGRVQSDDPSILGDPERVQRRVRETGREIGYDPVNDYYRLVLNYDELTHDV